MHRNSFALRGPGQLFSPVRNTQVEGLCLEGRDLMQRMCGGMWRRATRLSGGRGALRPGLAASYAHAGTVRKHLRLVHVATLTTVGGRGRRTLRVSQVEGRRHRRGFRRDGIRRHHDVLATDRNAARYARGRFAVDVSRRGTADLGLEPRGARGYGVVRRRGGVGVRADSRHFGQTRRSVLVSLRGRRVR